MPTTFSSPNNPAPDFSQVSPRIDPEKKAAWTAALRSGKYPQTTGNLCVRRNEVSIEDGERIVLRPAGFCCLGVEAELSVEEGLTQRVPEGSSSVAYLSTSAIDPERTYHERAVLPVQVAAWLGWSPDHVNPTVVDRLSLAQLNDKGFTFPQIADVIDYFL